MGLGVPATAAGKFMAPTRPGNPRAASVIAVVPPND
jgi:hypothetical protein